MLLDAVDEFIEDKKMWFRELAHDHGNPAERDITYKKASNADQLRLVEIEDDEDREQVENEIKDKMLKLN